MAFDFPNSPTVGQLYTAPTGLVYTWDGEKWGSGSGGGAIYIADSAPAAPPGSLWWESDTGNLYVNYNDGNSIQWVMLVGGNIDAVRYTVAQALTTAQQAQARANIGFPPLLTTLSAVLGADVNMTASGAWYDGPSVAQGNVGTWLAMGTAALLDTVGIAGLGTSLFDGTTRVGVAASTSTGANNFCALSSMGIFTNPAGNIRLQGNDSNGSPSGRIKAAVTSIVAVRIA